MSPLSQAVATALAPLSPSSDAGPRRLVVLIHGINADASSWQQMTALCRADERLRDFDFVTFEYATGLGRWHPLRRLPSLDTIASDLGGFLGRRDFRKYRDVRLVGHSQGGLVIQRFLHRMLLDKRGRELDWIRQVIFFATPTLGSGLFGGARRVIFSFIGNPQERELRIFNPAVAETRRFLDANVSEARERSQETSQIPVHVFYGEEDNVVDPESAMGAFSSTYAIPGDHSGLIVPDNEGDRRYTAFADLLLEPIGHRHVFEVERSEYNLRLEPADPTVPFRAPLPDARSREVSSSVVGHFTRRVFFSRSNRCEDLFEMRYATRDDGYVAARVIPPNQCSDSVRREYEQRGTSFRYHFHPEQRRDDGYQMFLTIHRGFEDGNQNLHLHVTKAGEESWARIGRLDFMLDLRPLLAAGWRLETPAEMRLLDVDRKHEECPFAGDEQLPGALGETVTPEQGMEPGSWRWSLAELQRGIVNVHWQVRRPT